MGRVGEGRRMSNKTSIPLEEKQAHRKQYSGLPSKTGPTKRSKHIVKKHKMKQKQNIVGDYGVEL